MSPRKPIASRRTHAKKLLPPLQFSQPLPYGAVLHDKGVQFVVYSRSGELLVTFYLASLAADVIRTIMERRQAG